MLRSIIRANSTTKLTHTIENKLFQADLVNDVPKHINKRLVRIYRPAPSPTQSGAGAEKWCLDWDPQERWENPLMGWSSSADPVQGLKLKFNTKEEAVLFAERQGYEWWLTEPKVTRFHTKSRACFFLLHRLW